jgi:hypothetical protein
MEPEPRTPPRVVVEERDVLFRGELRYDAVSEWIFLAEAEPRIGGLGSGGTARIDVGSLQIDVDVRTRLLLFVSGPLPRASWTEARLPAPVAARTGHVRLDGTPQPGASYPIAEPPWRTFMDRQAGVLLLAPAPETNAPGDLVLITDGTYLAISGDRGVSGGRMLGLWLTPKGLAVGAP